MDADFAYVSQVEAKEADTTGSNAPLDLSHHYSRITKRREESVIKKFYKFFQAPGIGNLAGGLPNASFFPYDTLEAQIARPERWAPTPNKPADGNELSRKVGGLSLGRKHHDTTSSTHVTVPHASTVSNPSLKIDLTTALQYGSTQGYPALYSFLKQFVRENLHPNIPYSGGPDIIHTNGNTDGFSKVLQAFTNIWDEQRDWVREREGMLCEEFAYMTAIQSAKPRGLNIVPVKIDFEGMLADGEGGLEDVLANWDEKRGLRPHLLYTVTIGQNPTSGLLSVQRRKEIYAVCQKYDVIIIEDDPYWYLQFPSSVGKEAESRNLATPRNQPPYKFEKSSGFEYLDSLVPSYLNVDTDGRVVRLDTFSKTIAPGCRLGWITAQPAIIERILRITEGSTSNPSGFVQAMVSEVLLGAQPAAVEYTKKSKGEQLSFKGWQVDGWVRWLEGLRGSYERRMNRMCDILDAGRFIVKQGTSTKSLDSEWAVISKTEMYSFDWPRAGMFVWVHMFFDTHPLASSVPGPELSQSFWVLLAQKPFLVLGAPGSMFSPTPEILNEKGWQYFRLCFAAVSEPEIESCSKAFKDGAKAFWAIKDKKDLPSLDDEVASEEGVVDLGMYMAC